MKILLLNTQKDGAKIPVLQNLNFDGKFRCLQYFRILHSMLFNYSDFYKPDFINIIAHFTNLRLSYLPHPSLLKLIIPVSIKQALRNPFQTVDLRKTPKMLR